MTRKFFTLVASIYLSMVGMQGQGNVFYVDNRNPACVNSVAGGSEAVPFCSMAYVATLNTVGRTYLVDSALDMSGPSFTGDGTSSAPIVYRSRNSTRLGGGTDLIDENFTPHVSGTPGVFTSPVSPGSGMIWQTFFDPIRIDDPNNASDFTMVDTDGPLKLSIAPDDATLFAQEGMYRYAGGGVWHVHTYGNRTPSTGGTDLILGTGATLNFDSNSAWLVIDGFRIGYTGSVASFNFYGSDHRLQNAVVSGIPLQFRGGRHIGTNIKTSHQIERDFDGGNNPDWLWHYQGSGISVIVEGPAHRLNNIEMMHAWNANIATDDASLTYPLIVNGAWIHGSPNHCSAGVVGATVLRNIKIHNCQDYNRIGNAAGMIIEHMTQAGDGIGVEFAMGALTIRNSVIFGVFNYIQGTGCNWSQTIIENNVLSTAGTIERCENATHYPIATYINNCNLKVWVNCATFRNNIFVNPAQWSSVIVGGHWNGSMRDVWDIHVVPGGPAMDIGVATATTTDLEGDPRPFGVAPDAGADEYVDLGGAIYVDNACANAGTGFVHTCAATAGGAGAFNTLQPALDALTSPGDTVYIKNGSGTYVTTSGSRGQNVSFDSGFAISSSGTEANPITVRNYPGHSPLIANCADGVTDTLSCARVTFSAWCEEGIRITGLRIRGSVGFHCLPTTEAGLKRWNTVDHTEITQGFADVDQNNWAGVWLSQQRYARVHHNYIHAITPLTNAGSQAGTSGIKMHTSVDATLEYNTIVDVASSTSGGGIDDKQDSVRNTVRYNWIADVSTCLQIQQQIGSGPYTTGTGTQIYQNVCIGRVGATTPLWRVGSGALTDVTVSNNVFYRGQTGLLVNPTSGSTDGIRHYNNIYDLIASDNIQSNFATTADIDREDYNTYDPDADYLVTGATYTSLAAYVAAVAARNAGSSEAACTFVNAGTDFHLVSGTCVGGGRVGGVSSGAALNRGPYVNGINCIGHGCEAPTGVK